MFYAAQRRGESWEGIMKLREVMFGTTASALLLAGCTSVSKEAQTYNNEQKTALEKCTTMMADEGLNPLRQKMPFLDGTAASPSMLSDNAMPTTDEKLALGIYLSKLTECNNLGVVNTKNTLGKEATEIADYFDVKDYLFVTDLMNGKISWATFNQERYKWQNDLHEAMQGQVLVLQQRQENRAAAIRALGSAMQAYGNALQNSQIHAVAEPIPSGPGVGQQGPVTYQAFGNMIQGSDGTSIQRFGNITTMTFPDGTSRSCTTQGNLTSCN